MQKYLWLIILAVIALAFIWPAPGILLGPALTYLLMLMMVLSCVNINLGELKKIRDGWWRYIVLTLFVFLLPTSIVFLFKNIIEPNIFVGLILVASVPSGISVVAISNILGGEPAKALIATSFTHIISPVVTPFLVWLFAKETIGIDFVGIMLLIGKLVILPMIVAQILRHTRWSKSLCKSSSKICIVLLMLLIWGIVAPATGLVLEYWKQVMVISIIVAIILIVEILVNIWFGRNKKEDITWAVVGTYKNFTLSSVIALSMFGPLAVLASVVYSILDNVILAPLQAIARRKKELF